MRSLEKLVSKGDSIYDSVSIKNFGQDSGKEFS